MQTFRRIIVLAGTALALTVLAPAVSAANPLPIHLLKDCSTFNGETPSLCTISESDMAGLPVGTKFWYQGPVLSNIYFLSSNVNVETRNGSTATGYCMFDARAAEQAGMCTFWAGTGDLAGFTSILHVSIDDLHEWHLDGVYYLDRPAMKHAGPGRPASPRPS
jgi:hypothetical protein